MCALVQARPQFSQRRCAGSVHGLLKISVVFLNDARNVHKIGTTTMIVQITRATWPRREKSRTSRWVRAGSVRRWLTPVSLRCVSVAMMGPLELDRLAAGDAQRQRGE